MGVPTVPAQDPQQGQIVFPNKLTPYASYWWTNQTITDIPADSVGWLLAQGWQITGVTKVESTEPPTPWFAMQRQTLQNWMILQSLLNEYTVAYNDAQWANSLRYNQVIANWTDMIASSQVQFDAQTSEHSAHVALYLSYLETYMDAIEALVTANQATIDAAVADIVTKLDSADTTLSTHATDYEAVITLLGTDYTTYVTDFSAVLDLLPTDYATYAAGQDAKLDLLPDDYDVHATTATAFLNDLGATDLARINEKYAALLSTQLSQLTDQGAYNSERATAIMAKNGRDREEEISALNDRLMREKFDNQHRLYEQQQKMRGGIFDGKSRLYEQQAAMRGRSLEGEDRMYERQVAMRGRTLDAKDRLHGLRQEVLRYRVAQLMGNANAVVEHKHKAITELMSAYAARLEGMQGQHAEGMKLMAYQLDERNKLLMGIYGFVERREDVGPQFEQLAQVCTSLGDAGGGWITP